MDYTSQRPVTFNAMRSVNPSQSATVQNRGPVASSSGNELPIIQQSDNLLIDARLLHQKLRVKSKFADWIKTRISDFDAGFDFFPISKNLENGGLVKDYHLTIDMAKELAMMERNEVGKSVRKYFIQVEKKLRGISQLPKEPELFKGLKPLQLNNRTMYPYKEINDRCGYSPRASSSRRKDAYWMHFVKWGSRLYITVEFSLQLFHQKRVSNNRPALKAMNPVIPANFGDPSQLKLAL